MFNQNIRIPSSKKVNEMWWLIDSAPDLWGRDPGLESGISHKDPDALQNHCEIMKNISG